MKRLRLAIVALGFALIGSTALAQGGPPSEDRPVVTLTGTTISVDPQVLRFARSKGAVVIQWRLPPGASYRFANNGIVINGEVDASAVDDQR